MNDSVAYKHFKNLDNYRHEPKKGFSTLTFSPGFFSHTLYFNNLKKKNNFGLTKLTVMIAFGVNIYIYIILNSKKKKKTRTESQNNYKKLLIGRKDNFFSLTYSSIVHLLPPARSKKRQKKNQIVYIKHLSASMRRLRASL